MKSYDLVVIGGGSAGLKAARTAAKLGKTVALAEERELGGECFWAGCVPTKALVRASEVLNTIRTAGSFGIQAEVIRADFADVMAWKDRAVKRVGGTIDEPDHVRMSRQGIDLYAERAKFVDTNVVQIGRQTVRGSRIIIATGTIPFVPYIEGLEETGYITNREAVNLRELPKRLIIIGGGPIGLEFAQVYRRFGAEITVIDSGPQLLPREEPEISELVRGFLRAEGIHILTDSTVVSVALTQHGKQVTVKTDVGSSTWEADEILVATGRAAAVGDLDLDAAGVRHSQRSISVDDYLRTNQPHILAAGDAAGGYLFTHVASYEGRLAAENAFSKSPVKYDSRVVPRVTFVDPEVASIGHTEAGANAAGMATAVNRFAFADLDRAILADQTEGVVKLISNRETGEIVGGHIVGPQASSLIAEIALAMTHNLTISSIARTMHAYPSFPEAIEAAALSAPTFTGSVEGI